MAFFLSRLDLLMSYSLSLCVQYWLFILSLMGGGPWVFLVLLPQAAAERSGRRYHVRRDGNSPPPAQGTGERMGIAAEASLRGYLRCTGVMDGLVSSCNRSTWVERFRWANCSVHATERAPGIML